jgi:phosphatidylglycerophosphatase C
MTAREVIAVFDFDGTLIKGDSFLRFVTWQRDPFQVTKDLLATSPLLALYALRLVPNDVHKMALFKRRFAGMRSEELKALGKSFAIEELPGMVRKEALECFREHQRRGHQTIVVSASLDTWLAPWAEAHQVDMLLASSAEIVHGGVTGRLACPNCFGREKVTRLFTALRKDRSAYEIYAYGDSRGDLDLLATADHAFFRKFS